MKRLVLLGLGKMGLLHLRTLLKRSDLQIVACVDPNSSHDTIPSYTTTDSLPEYDWALITTPSESHFLLAKEQLLAGKHVVVEKPICLEHSQATELLKLAQKQNLKLVVSHLENHNPAFITFKQHLLQGVVGDLLRLECRREGPCPDIPPTSGVLWDLGIHDIELLCSLYPSPISIESRFHHQNKVCHSLESFWKYDALEIQLFCSWISPLRQRHWKAYGQLGLLECDLIEQKVSFFSKTSQGNVLQEHLSISPQDPLESFWQETFSATIDVLFENTARACEALARLEEVERKTVVTSI